MHLEYFVRNKIEILRHVNTTEEAIDKWGFWKWLMHIKIINENIEKSQVKKKESLTF